MKWRHGKVSGRNSNYKVCKKPASFCSYLFPCVSLGYSIFTRGVILLPQANLKKFSDRNYHKLIYNDFYLFQSTKDCCFTPVDPKPFSALNKEFLSNVRKCRTVGKLNHFKLTQLRCGAGSSWTQLARIAFTI